MPKGHTNNPAGKPRGAINKTTAQAREAIAQFVEGNVDRLNGWLDTIAEKDAKQAFDCFMNVVEYHIPKLARAEVVGPNGGAVQVEHSVKPEDKEIIERFYKTKTMESK